MHYNDMIRSPYAPLEQQQYYPIANRAVQKYCIVKTLIMFFRFRGAQGETSADAYRIVTIVTVIVTVIL